MQSSISLSKGFQEISGETFNLKEAILNFEKERNNHEQEINDLKKQLNHFKNVSTVQQEEITSIKVKFEQTLNFYDQELSLREHIESKLEASSLTVDVLKSYMSRLGSVLGDCAKMKDKLIEQNKARDRQMKLLEEEYHSSDVEKKVKNLSEKFEELHKQHEQEKKDREEEFSQELSELHKNFEKLIETQKSEKETKLSECHLNIESLHRKIEEIRSSSADCLSLSEEKIKKLQASLEDLTKNLNASTEAVQKNEELSAQLRDDVSGLMNERDSLLVENKISHEKISALEKSIENWKEELRESQNLCVSLQESLKNFEKTTSILITEKGELEKSLVVCKKEIDELVEMASKERSNFEEILSNLDAVIKEKDIRIFNLEADLKVAKEFESKLSEKIDHNKDLCSKISTLTENMKVLKHDKEDFIKQLEVSKSEILSLNLKLEDVNQNKCHEISSMTALVEEKELKLKFFEDNVFKLQEENKELSDTVEEVRKQMVDTTEKSKDALITVETEAKIKVDTLEKENQELKDKMKAQVLKFMQSYQKKQVTIRKRNEMVKEAKAYVMNLKEKYFKSQQNVDDLQKLLAKTMKSDEDAIKSAKASDKSPLAEDSEFNKKGILKRRNTNLEHPHSQKKLICFQDTVLPGDEILTNASSDDLFEPLTQQVCRSWEEVTENSS